MFIGGEFEITMKFCCLNLFIFDEFSWFSGFCFVSFFISKTLDNEIDIFTLVRMEELLFTWMAMSL